ncbi:MAG: hypothetical protein JW747_08840 [Candidatus Aminicenantes bacterium]|nr:hypothetical protein [Candidatus Aminicenantes bacterium]
MKLKTDSPKKTIAILGFFILSLCVVAALNSACGKQAGEEQAVTPEAGEVAMIEEGLNTCEGTVRFVHGPFFYVPEIAGFDVVLPAGADASELEGRAVRVEGVFDMEKPSILAAERIDVREGESKYAKFFEKSEGQIDPPFLNQHDRNLYPALEIKKATASDAWEGKERGKVFGRLEKTSVAAEGGQQDVFKISVSDDKGQSLGTILVDSISDYALYSIKKLRLFDDYWFYLNIKESVEAKARARSKELFHADVVFAGLY